MKSRQKSKGKNNKNNQGGKGNQQKVKQIFDKLTEGKELMNDDQLFNFFESNLGMSSDDTAFGYIITTVMKLQKMDDVSFQNFYALFRDTKTSTVAQLKKKLPGLRKDAEYPDNFKHTYLKMFQYYKGTHTTLELEIAEQLWKVYLKNKLKFMDLFLEYLHQLPDRQTKRVHIDLWKMMLQFSLQVQNLKDYNENDGWPVFIDGLVEFINEKKK